MNKISAGPGGKKIHSRVRYQLVDVEKLDAAKPLQAIKEFEVKAKPKIKQCDLLIVGGGMGAVAAAIAACSNGLSVCLTEQTSWLGGQMTAQGVSALDENYMVETSGATRRYKAFRQSIREHYKALGGVEGLARFESYLDPGNCWVSRLAFEPKVAVKLLDETLSPYVKSGKLQIFVRTQAIRVKRKQNKINSVQCVDLDTGKISEFRCRFCIDATELGDLLPLAGIDYRSGADSSLETGEAHAPEKANPENVQDFTYPFALEFCPGESHVISKPPHYDEFCKEGKFSLLGYRVFENNRIALADGRHNDLMPFWEYRRLVAAATFPSGTFPHDISMINWESNDLRGENIIDQSAVHTAERLALAKYLSLGFLYWMQTELDRDDGGKGYPELKLRADIMGTEDGVSKYPYIRESRRVKAKTTIIESDITRNANPDNVRAKSFSDSVGIGLYPVDIHGKQDVPGAGQATRPFQIPASSLVQTHLRNFLPACKNIGTTHITNGAYRLHPIEWAIGEAAGTFASEVLSRRTDIVRFLKNKNAVKDLQNSLITNGSPIVWYDDVNPEHRAFAAIQYVSACALMQIDSRVLSFRPEEPLTRSEAAYSISKLLCLSQVNKESLNITDLECDDSRYESASLCVTYNLMALRPDSKFEPGSAITVAELNALASQIGDLGRKELPQTDPVSRADFAQWLYPLSRKRRFL